MSILALLFQWLSQRPRTTVYWVRFSSTEQGLSLQSLTPSEELFSQTHAEIVSRELSTIPCFGIRLRCRATSIEEAIRITTERATQLHRSLQEYR